MSDALNLPESVPPLTQFYFYLTAGCNLACQHCWLSPSHQSMGGTGGHLDLELFKLALDEGMPLGLNHVKLTGGEPMLHPDLLKMVEILREKGVGLTLETNGTLMTPEIAHYLRDKGNVYHVSISLDGAKADTHDPFRGVRGSFDKAVAGLKMLVAEGFRPQVIMSLHQGNVDEIEALVQQAEAWGAGSVKFNLIQPSGRGENFVRRGRGLDIRKMVKVGRWVEHDLQKRTGINLLYSWPMIFFSLDRLVKRGREACAIINILGVLPNGSLAMCGIGMAIPELTYGQLGRDKIKDVWCENQVLQSIRTDIPGKLEEPCAGCLFKWQCLGHCIAENYFQSRKLTAPFWFCKLAESEGLLPVQRTNQFLDNIVN